MARANVRWDLIDDPVVREVAASVAATAGHINEGIIADEDLEQEALMLVATRRELQDPVLEEDYGLLHYRLTQALYNAIIRPLSRSGALDAMKYKFTPLPEDDEHQEPYVLFDSGSGDYTPDAIKVLLPAVWDETYCFGLPRQETAPDPDMPKGSTNKARGGSLFAYIADVKTGWHSTPLTRKERCALLLHCGMGWTQDQVAHNQMVGQPVIARRISSGLQKIAARLNGAGWHIEQTTIDRAVVAT